ncbi:MAG: hypothetical protein P0Y64_00830 [Candidatus Sphingomonas colombiensis]|nr:hypothetical protein [Sphingomonas sp.]WEK43423.1 MAG: hypothetical protein P0Y64_00830 [Sphingomonas sp.]
MTKIASSRSKRGPIRHIIAGIAAIALLLGATEAANVPQDEAASGMIAAERRFAADAARIGIASAFRAHVAPDGILIRPDPAPAPATLASDVDTPGVRLEWQPAIAAVARSGDLGFTTGPYQITHGDKAVHGRFLTVWERGSDGAWRWYLDHGMPPIGAGPGELASATVTILRRGVAAKGAAAPGASEADVALNALIVAEGTGVIADYLAPDGHLLRVKRGVVRKADARGDSAAVRSVETLGIRVSAAGDLAASYGRLIRVGEERAVYYVRVWRRDRAGWRLLVDRID